MSTPGGSKRASDITNIEEGEQDHRDNESWRMILKLAFQSIGVVYGDIGTSPLYVYASTFTDGIKHKDDILGVLSIIFYTITLIPVIKYVVIVLRANDHGDGGTFALYSKLCRYAKVGLIPSEQAEDREVSNFRLELPNKSNRIASSIKQTLESSNFSKFSLLFVAMLGTSMVIGDGILTPSMSVLSAVSGLKKATDSMTEGTEAMFADLGHFSVKSLQISMGCVVYPALITAFGTDKVGYTFAPIICVWFSLIVGIGVYNFFKFDPLVAKAINPIYIIDYFERNKKDAWISLGGLVLAITDGYEHVAINLTYMGESVFITSSNTVVITLGFAAALAVLVTGVPQSRQHSKSES
nr:potassium transporter 19-like [Tanacetum cinerariifolium]